MPRLCIESAPCQPAAAGATEPKHHEAEQLWDITATTCRPSHLELGENWCSTIDLVCISANHFNDIKRFEVEDVEKKGKHAVIRVDIRVKEYARRSREKKGKKRGGVKVCRPDVGKVAAYATKHFQRREEHFQKLHGELLEGKVSATEVLQEVMGGIRQCVRLANEEAVRKGKISGKKEGNVGAAWYDEECEVVNERARAARWNLRDAKRAIPPLQEVDLEAMQDLVTTLRADYQRMARRKQKQQKHDLQKQLIKDYYSSSPKNFWDVFKQGLKSKCELDDLDACTAYFQGLLGENEHVDKGQGDTVLGSWSPEVQATQMLDDADREILNAPLTREELCYHIKACKNRKAADLEGMTAEAMKLVVASRASSMLDCVAAVIDGCHKEVPKQMTQNKLTPIPKEAHSGQNVQLYRGISVANLFGKLGDKFRCERLTRISEEKGIRCFTQCGFRPEHGTLDAAFAFLHAADLAKAKGKEHALIACLVDFEKAFDKAHRGLMLKRLSEFGVSGPFYDALVALYDKIQMVVCLDGEQGKPFDTYQGTKQGSELSPLLFGMFIEQLHELLKEKVPGAGPKFGKVNVPDIMYADDVNLLVVDDAKQMQELLNVLQLFCDLFGMKVNMKKTKLMIIRSGQLMPEHLKEVVLTYNGQLLSVSEQEKYLGLVMHECKSMITAGQQRGALGAKAYHSMMVTVAQKGLQRPDILCDLFDKKVRPVLSYGAHIWGPYMFNRWAKKDPLNCENKPEKVHTAFLRRISGMGKSVHKASLYKEYGRYPLMLQWLVLAARFWNKMAERRESALINMAYKDNVKLMLRGKKCWTWHFLKAMLAIGAIENEAAFQVQGRKTEKNVHDTVEKVSRMHFDEEMVENKAWLFFDRPWAQCGALNPATAPSKQVFLSTYKNWVGVHEGGAKHLSHFIPIHLRRQLVGLKCGSHPLNVHRMRFHGVPREARTCQVCGQKGMVEDLKHFMLDCEHYAPLRAKHTNIFSSAHLAGKDDSAVLRMVLNHEHQLDLACCVQEMFTHREAVLEVKEVVQGHQEGQIGVRAVNEGNRSQYYNLRNVHFKLPEGFFEVYD